MWNTPSREKLSTIPKLYETEGTPASEKIIHFHFFIGGSDFFACEYDGYDLFFGFTILNGDQQNAEWGYFSMDELKAINVHGVEVDTDLYWTPRKAREVDKIRQCMK